MELLITEYLDDLALLRLNRKDKLNALNREFISSFNEELVNLEKDPKVKGIIITGSDRSFIVGADIHEMKNLDTESSVEFISSLHTLISTIRNHKKPVFASVNGYCFGAGLELAVSCDMIIASQNASFGMQEVKIGIPSVIEAALLPFIIGITKTRELLLTGEVIDSKTALELGLVNYVVPENDLLTTTINFANKIVCNPLHSVSMQKQLINRWLENAGVEQSIKNGIDFFGVAFGNKNTNEILRNALK